MEKGKTRLIAGACAVCLTASLLAGCGGSGKPPVPARPAATAPNGGTRATESIVVPEKVVLGESASVTPLTVSPEQMTAFAEELSGLEVSYGVVDELYDVDSAGAFFQENLHPVSSHRNHGILKNGAVDEAALLQKVKENNTAFDPNEHEGALFYRELEDGNVVKDIVAVIADSINCELPFKSAGELEELDCVLGELCILETSGLSAASVTGDNILIVNPAMMDVMALHVGNADGLLATITHEAKHLLQVDCNENKEGAAWRMGVCYQSDDLERNPYFWTWLLEAAAEKNTVAQLGTEPETYQALIGYLDTLDLTTILSERAVSGREVDKLALTRDQQGLLRLLGQDRGMTEAELVSMMFAMEVMQNRASDLPDFYQKQFGQELTEEEYKDLRVSMRPAFLLECSKIFYTYLADALRDAEDVTLEDVFYLLSVWEADVNYHMDYTEGSPTEPVSAFMNAYQEVQTAFFDELAGENSGEEIEAQFREYHPFVKDESGNPEPNCRLSWLSEQKRAWIGQKAGSKKMNYAPAMGLVLESCQ